MMSSATRRQALFGRGAVTGPMPWTDAERLRTLCTGCGACADACPEGIVISGRGGVPALAFASPCTFCGACAAACGESVFEPERDPPWSAKASIGPSCLEISGVSCRACEDACDAAALRARPMLGGRARIVVDAEACTGCGACVSVCPTGAVEIVEHA
jgi:ferredoxin-type protein NapF